MISALVLAATAILSSAPAHAGECVAGLDKSNAVQLRNAVHKGSLKLFKTCLQLGVDQDTVAFGEAMTTIIFEGRLDFMEAALLADPTIPSRELKGLTYPLQIAARIRPGFNGEENQMARYQIVDLLLANGANPGKADGVGQTALYAAALVCNPKLVDKFAALGADPNLADDRRITPLKRAAFECRMSSLLPIDEPEIDAMIAEITKTLLAKGAYVETSDSLGGYVLHQLARSSRVAAAKLVVQAGADVNAEDQSGCRPFDYAKRSHRQPGPRKAMLDYLKSLGATAGPDCDVE